MLTQLSSTIPLLSVIGKKRTLPNVDIDKMYADLCLLEEEGATGRTRDEELGRSDARKEDFWREMEHSDDPFETICFYISKGYLDEM